VEKGTPLARWKGHDSSVRSVAFSPDGKRVVSGSLDNSLILWEVEKGKPEMILYSDEEIYILEEPDQITYFKINGEWKLVHEHWSRFPSQIPAGQPSGAAKSDRQEGPIVI
jgi:WD40 repeat protein